MTLSPEMPKFEQLEKNELNILENAHPETLQNPQRHKETLTELQALVSSI
jgi:hypothetical protein